jgi:hypothetical protein
MKSDLSEYDGYYTVEGDTFKDVCKQRRRFLSCGSVAARVEDPGLARIALVNFKIKSFSQAHQTEYRSQAFTTGEDWLERPL